MPVLKPLTEPRCSDRSRATFVAHPTHMVVLDGTRDRHVFHINVGDWSVYHEHVEPHCADIGPRDAVTLSYLLYLYALRIANTKNMRKWTSVDKAQITNARESLFAHHQLVQYKMATLRCVVDRLDPATDMTAIAQHFMAVGLRPTDAILFALLHFNDDLRAFVDLVAAIPDDAFTLEPNALRRELETNPALLAELNKTAGYFTYRKLKFVVEGNRLGYGSIYNDLRMRGTQAYYWVRPFYGVEHAVNYAKQAIYKHAMNTIAYYNDPARARTRAEGEGYVNTVVELNDFMLPRPQLNWTEDAMIELLDFARSGESAHA